MLASPQHSQSLLSAHVPFRPPMPLPMYSFEWMIGVALVCFAGGLGLGALLGQSMGSSRKVRSLQEELASAQRELFDYRAEVYDEFAETARRFEQLNDSYRGLHQQLATSASKLLGDNIGSPLLAGPAGGTSSEVSANASIAKEPGELAAAVTDDADPAASDPTSMEIGPVTEADVKAPVSEEGTTSSTSSTVGKESV